jgi:hypothetical protein
MGEGVRFSPSPSWRSDVLKIIVAAAVAHGVLGR